MAAEPTTAIKFTVIVASKNFGGGSNSDSWWFPGKTEVWSTGAANTLAQLRSAMSGFLAGVQAVRRASYTGDPMVPQGADGSLRRKFVLQPNDNDGLGWFTPLPSVLANDPTLKTRWAAYKAIGVRANLRWADGSRSVITIPFPYVTLTAPAIPGVGSYDWGPAAGFKTLANDYFNKLIEYNAARLKIVLPYTKYDIIGGVNGDSRTNQAGGVFISGDRAALFPPNSIVKIGDRFNPRLGLRRSKGDRGLGVRRTLQAVYSAAGNPAIGQPPLSTFIPIVCSVQASGFSDPCVTPGWVAVVKKSWVPLDGYDVTLTPRRMPSRGRRRV